MEYDVRLFTLVLWLLPLSAVETLTIDPNGYIVYCPCMGRFGNQADHFLGMLSLARSINRTLLLPAWVEYDYRQPKATMANFDRYFQVTPLLEYHRVLLMESFMNNLAPEVWPPSRRKSYCWSQRSSKGSDGCDSKGGNPFGPFWDHYGVDFIDSVYYGARGGHTVYMAKSFDPVDHPVLAFTGAPVAFPVAATDRKLHRYLKWSVHVDDMAESFIRNTLPHGGFLGIHLRNHLDWANVCKHVANGELSPGGQMFSSPQCLGENGEYGTVTMELCQPSQETILKQVRGKVIEIGAKSVFVASDKDHMIDTINSHLADLKVTAYRQHVDEPHVSLAILAKADFYIGNCLSTFSAFAKRQRDAEGKMSAFWAFPLEHKLSNTNRPEL